MKTIKEILLVLQNYHKNKTTQNSSTSIDDNLKVFEEKIASKKIEEILDSEALSDLKALISVIREEIIERNLLSSFKEKLIEDKLDELGEPHALLQLFFDLIEIVVVPADSNKLKMHYEQNKKISAEQMLSRMQYYLGCVEAFPEEVQRWLINGGIEFSSWEKRPTNYIDILLWDELSAFNRNKHPKQFSLGKKILRTISMDYTKQPSLVNVCMDCAIQFNPSTGLIKELIRENSGCWKAKNPEDLDALGAIRYIASVEVSDCHTLIVRRPKSDDFWMLHVSPQCYQYGKSFGIDRGRTYECLNGKNYDSDENIGLYPNDEIEVVFIKNSQNQSPQLNENFGNIKFNDMMKEIGCILLRRVQIISSELTIKSSGEWFKDCYNVAFDYKTREVSVIPYNLNEKSNQYPNLFSVHTSEIIKDKREAMLLNPANIHCSFSSSANKHEKQVDKIVQSNTIKESDIEIDDNDEPLCPIM